MLINVQITISKFMVSYVKQQGRCLGLWAMFGFVVYQLCKTRRAMFGFVVYLVN